RQNFTGPPRTDPQLFSRPERVLQRCNRGSEQQSKSHYEKILRVPNLARHRTGALSFTWQTARARTHPQILLTNHFSLSRKKENPPPTGSGPCQTREIGQELGGRLLRNYFRGG